MFRLICLSLVVIAVSACTRQTPAPVTWRGEYYYGREGGIDSQGNPIPKYSPSNPAPQSEYNREKYSSSEEKYSVAADVDSVTSSDLPAPNASPAAMPQEESLAPINSMATQTTPKDSYVPLTPQQPVTVETTTAPQNFVWPLKGKVVSAYAENHSGLSIAARAGEPIRAAADGVVSSTTSTKDGSYMAIIQHGNWTTTYGRAGDLVVKRGDRVVQGQLIGFVGKAPSGTDAQLSFGMTKDNQPVDPQAYLK
ncbi:MAG: M23 family metallopeptidase [Rickettsiales bacterium]